VVWLYQHFFINESDLLKGNFNAKRDWILKPIEFKRFVRKLKLKKKENGDLFCHKE